jgi:hypothetical protein
MQDKLEEVSEKTMEVNRKKEVSLEEISKTVEQVLKYLILGTEISSLSQEQVMRQRAQKSASLRACFSCVLEKALTYVLKKTRTT